MEHFDIEKAPLEIERKFLIRYPDIEKLKEMPDYRCVHIEQSYLDADDDFVGGRIRRITEGATVTYIYTFKEKISDLTRYEFEKAITREEYLQLLSHKTPDTITIEKDRHSFSYAGLTYDSRSRGRQRGYADPDPTLRRTDQGGHPRPPL